MAFRNDEEWVLGTEPAVPTPGETFAVSQPAGTRIVREVESVRMRDEDGLLECVIVSDGGSRWLLVEREEADGATEGRWEPALPLPPT